MHKLPGETRFPNLVLSRGLTDLDTHWPSPKEWKAEGAARYIGVTVSQDARHADLEAFLRPARRRVAQADAKKREQQLECCWPTSQTGAISRFAIKARARSHSLSFGFF